MKRNYIALALALVLALGAAGCGNNAGAVSVQRADRLMQSGQAKERYAGMVVSENVEEITRDNTKRVAELYVEVGQQVKAGDKLFTYDSASLELELEKAQLEVEKMTGEQQTYADQLKDLEKQLKKASGSMTKTQLTLEINTLKTTMLENEYNLKAKAVEIETLEQMTANVDILSPVDGTIRKIDEQGQTESYITIQQSGAYRIKGTVNEMSMASGALYTGARVKAYSRVSDDTWTGTVTSIDTEDNSQGMNNMMTGVYVGGSDMMSTASSYVFYVELDSVEGLLLGQHVYLELFSEQPAAAGLWLPDGFLLDIVTHEDTGAVTTSVWVENAQGKLEQRSVELGMYDAMTGCWEVLSGLSAEDYVADPYHPGCANGVATQRRDPEDFSGTAEG